MRTVAWASIKEQSWQTPALLYALACRHPKATFWPPDPESPSSPCVNSMSHSCCWERECVCVRTWASVLVGGIHSPLITNPFPSERSGLHSNAIQGRALISKTQSSRREREKRRGRQPKRAGGNGHVCACSCHGLLHSPIIKFQERQKMLYVAIIYHRNPQSFRQMNIYRDKSHRVFICRKPSDNHKVTKYVLFWSNPKHLGKMCTFAIFTSLK